MSDWKYGYWDHYSDPVYKREEESVPGSRSAQEYCSHDWKPVLLLYSTVFDCSKCNAKKEEVELESKRRG